jgi:hypothetical protein
MTRLQKKALVYLCLAVSLTLFFAFGGGGGFGTFSRAYHSLSALPSSSSSSKTGAGCDPDMPGCKGGAAHDEPGDDANTTSNFWNERVTYPTGKYNPLWLRHAATQAEKVKAAVPAGSVAKFTAIAGTRAANQSVPLTNSFTALGPAPEHMGGCSGCYDYTTTEGRVNSIVVDPTTTTPGSIVAYAASDGGGVWKTTNCCSTSTKWTVSTDNPLVSDISIDSLTIDPNDHNTIYAGTGDLNYGSFSMGSQGILKSTDAGATWTVIGASIFGPALTGSPTVPSTSFPQYDSVGKVRVDPNNSNIVAAGTKTGVYLSYDGGSNWTGPCVPDSFPTMRQDITGLELTDMGGGVTRILAAVGVRGFATTVQYNLDQNGANGIYSATMPSSGCPSFTSIASDSNGFVFGTQVTGSPYGTGGQMHAGSGVKYTSTSTTTNVGDQLGRIDIAVAPSDPNTIYAQVGSIASNSGSGCGTTAGCQLGAWVSTNGGTSWTFMAGSAGGSLRACGSSGSANSTTNNDYPQNWYDQGIAVDPNNPDRAFFDTFEIWMATRTGTTWYDTTCAYTQPTLGMHADEHALAFLPGSSSVLLAGNDGGTDATLNANAAVLNTTRPTWFNMDGASVSNSLNTIEYYNGDIWGGNATNPFFGPYTGGTTPWAVGGAQDNMDSTVHFAGTPTGPVQWQGNVGGDGFWAAIDGKGGYFYVTNNSGALHRCVNTGSNCANSGSVYPSTNIASTVTSTTTGDGLRTSFASPFDLFRGNIGGTGNAECGTRCNHMIYGTYRVWEDTSVDTASFGSVANAVRTGDLTKNTLGNRSFINQLHYAPQNQTLAIVATNDGNVQVLYGLGGANGVHATNVDVTGGNTVLPNRPILDARLDENVQNTAANPFMGYAAVGGFNANTPSTPGHVFQFTCSTVNCTSFSWQDKTGNLPDIPVDSIQPNPNYPQQVFAGTDFGLYFTNDITAPTPTWYKFQNGMPSVMVWSMQVDRANSALSVWTRSRGAYAWPLPTGAIKQAQTISFGSLSDATFGDPDFAVSATSDSGLAVTFIGSGACTVTGSMVHIISGGTCTVTAQQAGNIDYNAATDVPQSFNVARINQTITFPAISDHTTGDADFPAGASSSSGLDISYTGNANCSVNGSGLVHLIHIGTCTIDASQPGDASYFAATDQMQSFNVTRGAQTIDFNLSDKAYGDADFQITATATSGLSVSLAKVSGQCTIDSSTSPANVNITGPGSCTITASQDGNDDFFAADDVTRTFNISKGSQTITFAALADKTWGDADFDISASSSSGLDVTYAAQDDCTITGTTVHILSAGTCTITASQTGDSNYNPASDVQRTFTINRAAQTIDFVALSDKTYGDGDFSVSATSSAGLSVGFSVDGQCALVSGQVHITGAGTCTVTASQGGNTNYLAAPDAPRTFTIAKATQSIDFAALPDKTYGDPDFDISASASSGLTVTFSTSGDCVLEFGQVSITGAGSCTVTASQGGGDNYLAASDVPRTFTIAKADQSITFGAVDDSTFGDSDFEISPTASSGLTVALDASGPCSLSAAVSPASVHISGAGTCTITASQDGNGNFNGAVDVPRSFSISKASQSITFATPADRTYGDPDFDPSATASSGDDVTYHASGTCSVTPSEKIEIDGAGSCIVTASQTGNGNYNPAPDVQRTFTIHKAAQAISIATNAPSGAVYGTTFAVAASGGGSGNSVAYSSAGACSNSGVHFTMTAGTGTCTVKYDEAGNANYNAAPQQSETVNAQKATLSITANNRQKYYAQVFPLGTTAFSSTGLVGSDSVFVTLTSAGSAAGAATGDYTISASNAVGGPNTSASDYAITYHTATLHVSPVGIIGLSGVSVATSAGKIDSFNSLSGVYGSSNRGSAALVMSNGPLSFSGVSLLGGTISTTGTVSVAHSASVSGNVLAGTTASIAGHVGGTVTQHSLSASLALAAAGSCSTFSTRAGITGAPGVFTYSGGNLVVKSGIVKLANGAYCFHNLTVNGGAVLQVSGPVTIGLTGKLSMKGKHPSITNTTQLPSKLQISTSFSGANGVTIVGSNRNAMTLLAPKTSVTILRGEYFGTVFAKTVSLNAGTVFHADMH